MTETTQSIPFPCGQKGYRAITKRYRPKNLQLSPSDPIKIPQAPKPEYYANNAVISQSCTIHI
jgi:hypothetical protein